MSESDGDGKRKHRPATKLPRCFLIHIPHCSCARAAIGGYTVYFIVISFLAARHSIISMRMTTALT